MGMTWSERTNNVSGERTQHTCSPPLRVHRLETVSDANRSRTDRTDATIELRERVEVLLELGVEFLSPEKRGGDEMRTPRFRADGAPEGRYGSRPLPIALIW